MLRIFRAKNENGNNIVFVLGIILALAALFGFAIDSIRYMHVRNAVQQALDKSSVAWLTAYNYAPGNHSSRVSTATQSAQIVYRDNIGYISDLIYCPAGPCGNTIGVLNPTSSSVTLIVTEKMDFVYFDTIKAPNGVSLEEGLNNNPNVSTYRSESIIGNPAIP
jgi:hypothetical protein